MNSILAHLGLTSRRPLAQQTSAEQTTAEQKSVEEPDTSTSGVHLDAGSALDASEKEQAELKHNGLGSPRLSRVRTPSPRSSPVFDVPWSSPHTEAGRDTPSTPRRRTKATTPRPPAVPLSTGLSLAARELSTPRLLRKTPARKSPAASPAQSRRADVPEEQSHVGLRPLHSSGSAHPSQHIEVEPIPNTELTTDQPSGTGSRSDTTPWEEAGTADSLDDISQHFGDEKRYTIKQLVNHRWAGDDVEIRVEWLRSEPTWEAEAQLQHDAPESVLRYWREHGGRPPHPEDPDIFTVFAILGHSRDRKKLKVQWAGFGPEDASMEPRQRVKEWAPEMAGEYWLNARKPRQRRTR